MLESAPYLVPPWFVAPWFAGWGTLSLINAGLAQSKHRSGLAWWLISLLLGPVATFLVVVLPPGDNGASPWQPHRTGARITRARQRSQS